MKKLLIVCALCIASAAFAQAPAQAPATDPASTSAGAQSTAAAADPNETICRNIDTTGTRLGRSRSCKTRAQWESADRQARANAERAQARSQD